MSYKKFGLMILTSTFIMYLAMYLNNYEFGHVYWSETRFYMSILMGSIMAVVMLLFMLNKYPNKKINSIIILLSVGFFSGALYLVRSQATIEDVAWMKAMIPHHSIAILTSSRASFSDPRVQKLANEIIAAQNKEIKEMKALIEDLEN
ncbi:DUF305 domain-containing protein [Marinicella litoralis]|uniref:DUF305 domain-containing protein n=1 Tax=Marinicella litoralis TaxID=644220 RepID=A0A4R6XHT9_9GAMM|nr:DUF305 domain-containing protein [Marinicella litoralis]TDR17440.1 hypothetical protein C8D91_2498 [Marinicella litoralis]